MSSFAIQSVKPRSVGLASGAIWLIVIGGGFAAWSIFAIGSWPKSLIVGWLAFISALTVGGIVVIRAALRLPSTHAATPERRQIRKRFLLVFGLELLAFAIVNPIAAMTRHFELMPSLNLVIVGIHFIPLAWIFRVPRYYVMGLLFCAIPAMTLLAIPSGFLVGQALAWYVVPTLGCGLVATSIGAVGLFESWQILAQFRRSSI